MSVQAIEKPSEAPVKTLDEICDAVNRILVSNGVNKGTKRARTMECSFIQGVLWTDPRHMTMVPMLAICLMSGRSIFDFNKK